MSEVVVAGTSKERIERERLAKMFAEGGKRAMALMRQVVEGKKNNGHRRGFNGDLVLDIHKQITFYAHEDVRGKFRDSGDNTTYSDGVPVLEGRRVPRAFQVYSEWLEKNVGLYQERALLITNMKDTGTLYEALFIAAGAHWGLVTPELHPFADGNDRTARVLVNGILMLGTKELLEFGIGVPPVPILRYRKTEKGRLDPYLSARRQIAEKGSLNPLAKYVAETWIINLDQRMTTIRNEIKKPNKADLELIKQFEWRKKALEEFVLYEEHGSNDQYPVPDEFHYRKLFNFF